MEIKRELLLCFKWELESLEPFAQPLTAVAQSRGDRRLEIHPGGWKCDRSGTDVATTLLTSLDMKPQRVLD